MTEDDKIAMKRFGITYEQKTIFTFLNYKYERLADALKYAENAVDNASSPADDAKE